MQGIAHERSNKPIAPALTFVQPIPLLMLKLSLNFGQKVWQKVNNRDILTAASDTHAHTYMCHLNIWCP